MNIKDLGKLEDECIAEINNYEKRKQYIDSFVSYINQHNFSEEIIDLIIKGMPIDNGANFLDYIETLATKDLNNVLKKLSNSKSIKNDNTGNALKLLMELLYFLIIEYKKYKEYISVIMTRLINKITDKKNGCTEDTYGPVFLDSFVNQVESLNQLPEWKNLNISSETMLSVINIFISVLDSQKNNNKASIVHKWLNDGRRYAMDLQKKENLERQIPNSKFSDLIDIADHYKEIESQLRVLVYENDKLKDEILHLNNILNEKKLELKNTENTINLLEIELKEEKRKSVKAEEEIKERKKLNKVQVEYRKESEETLLNEIARALKIEFEDYLQTKNTPMSEILGEIYREKLGNVVKILEQKGIKVDQ